MSAFCRAVGAIERDALSPRKVAQEQSAVAGRLGSRAASPHTGHNCLLWSGDAPIVFLLRRGACGAGSRRVHPVPPGAGAGAVCIRFGPGLKSTDWRVASTAIRLRHESRLTVVPREAFARVDDVSNRALAERLGCPIGTVLTLADAGGVPAPASRRAASCS